MGVVLIYVYCEMVITVKLIYISITTQYLPFILFFFKVKTLNIYPLSKFQVKHTVLLTVVAVLYLRSPELIHPV